MRDEQYQWICNRLHTIIEALPAKDEAKRPSDAASCSAFRSISEEGLKQQHWNHLRAAEEMARAHIEQSNCIGVLLEFYPEMGERTSPISVLLREIFEQNAGGMARELAAQDSDDSNDING